MPGYFVGCVSVNHKGPSHLERYGIIYIVFGMLLVWLRLYSGSDRTNNCQFDSSNKGFDSTDERGANEV